MSAFFVVFGLMAVQSTFASMIGGFVFDPSRVPISNVDVELLNENYSVQNRVKTDGSGRYQFEVFSDGRYYVRVLPFRFNFEDQTEEVLVNTLSLLGGGNMNFYKDFYLVRKKGGLGETTTGVVFAQSVPQEAEELYKAGIDDLENKNAEAGMKKLLKAIQIFPEYYAASQQLAMQFPAHKTIP